MSSVPFASHQGVCHSCADGPHVPCTQIPETEGVVPASSPFRLPRSGHPKGEMGQCRRRDAGAYKD